MTDPIDNSGVVAALRRQMTKAAAKELAAASNLANLNTPGYRAEEPVFSEALDGALNLPLSTSNDGHLQADGTAGEEVVTGRQPVASLSARRDGNTVQLDRELMSMMTAAGEFKAAQTALSAKFRLVRYAITEGR